MTQPNDAALLLISYGAPERREEIVPYIQRVLAGKNVPPERITQVAERYERLGRETGMLSPLNQECRDLISALSMRCAAVHKPGDKPCGSLEKGCPIYWGNLFGEPFLSETLAEMIRDGVRDARVFATSAFDSPPGRRRYIDALEKAGHALRAQGAELPVFHWIPPCCAHPLFHEAVADRIFETIACMELEPGFTPILEMSRTIVLFSVHSIPIAATLGSPYIDQVYAACASVMRYLRISEDIRNRDSIFVPSRWELVYQSRSGRPEEPWLEPDIKDYLLRLPGEGMSHVLIVPIGFFCENMETVYDLDIEARALCEKIGFRYFRTRAVGAEPKIIQMLFQEMNSFPMS